MAVAAQTPPVVDGHSDLLLELCFAERERGEDNPFAARWLKPLAGGGVALQVCAIYVDHDRPPDRALREALDQARAFNRAVRANPERVFAVRTAADLADVGRSRIGLMLALEGASVLGSDPLLLDVFADLGVRMASLTWNERNAFAEGCDGEGGLTDLGRGSSIASSSAVWPSTSLTLPSRPSGTCSRSVWRAASWSATPPAARCTTTRATCPTSSCARWPITTASSA